MNETSAERAFTVQEIARRYRVSASTIWRWVESGRLPHPAIQSGHCTRWLAQQIESHEKTLLQSPRVRRILG